MKPELRAIVVRVKQVVAETLTDKNFFFHRGDKIIQRRRPMVGKRGTTLYFPLVEIETDVVSQEESEHLYAIRTQACDAIFAAFNIHGGYVGCERYVTPANHRKVFLKVSIPDHVFNEPQLWHRP